jgi:hypothetical protein
MKNADDHFVGAMKTILEGTPLPDADRLTEIRHSRGGRCGNRGRPLRVELGQGAEAANRAKLERRRDRMQAGFNHAIEDYREARRAIEQRRAA